MGTKSNLHPGTNNICREKDNRKNWDQNNVLFYRFGAKFG